MKFKKRFVAAIITTGLLLFLPLAMAPETVLASDDVIIDFGSAGTWVLYDGSDWSKLHSGSPESIVSGDLDGSGQEELIIDFGNSGIWVRSNNESWSKLHSISPATMTTGDIDGNLKDDVIIDFGPGVGIWMHLNNSTWTKLHSLSAEIIETGDIDGNRKDDVIIDFGSGSGIWVWMNNTTWVKLHSLSPELITAGNVDGNLIDDVIFDFGTGGLWIWKNNRTWEKLHELSVELIKTGDLDGNGKDDVIFDFGFGMGIWVRMNDTTWEKLHSLTPELIEAGDIDGNGKDDVMIDFGAVHGMWIRYDSHQWKQRHTLSPETVVCGDMSGSNNKTYMISGKVTLPGYDQPGQLWLTMDGVNGYTYGAGPSDANGNFSIQATVPSLTDELLIYAVMPDNPEIHIKGYVDLIDHNETSMLYASAAAEPIYEYFGELGVNAHAKALVHYASGVSQRNFSPREEAAAQKIAEIMINKGTPPKFCSPEKIPTIDSILVDVIHHNLGDEVRTIFDSFVQPDSDDHLLDDVADAQEFITDNVFSANQLEDVLSLKTVPIFRPLRGVTQAKLTLSRLNLPSDNGKVQISTISREKLEAAAALIMNTGFGNCQEHGLVGTYMASRFPQFKQVAFVTTDTSYTWLTGSGHAFAVACEEDKSVWDIEDLVHAPNEQRLISTKLYDAGCIIIDSWKPGTGVTERLTVDKVVDLRWDSYRPVQSIMKVDLTGGDIQDQSSSYQSRAVEEISSEPQPAEAPPGTCSVGEPSCESCPTGAQIAATVCKPFSIPVECPEDPAFNQISLSVMLLQHLRDFVPNSGYVYDYDGTPLMGPGNIPGSISGNTFQGSYSRTNLATTTTGTVSGTLSDCSRVIESITWNETTQWTAGWIETISFSGTNIERYRRYPTTYEYGVVGAETCLHVSSFDYAFTSTPDARNATLLGYECYDGGSYISVDFHTE